MFWNKKKEDEEPSFDEDFGMSDRPVMPGSETSFERSAPSALSKLSELDSQGHSSSGDFEKDVQLILAKLDAIQHLLDNLNQRVKNIERIAESE